MDLEALRSHVNSPALAARALPFAAYRSPAIFAAERQRLLHRDWIAVCSAQELADAGDYVAFRLAGEPVLVLRGRDGELRALSNVCRHRGTPLFPDGRGRAERIVCPYHAWSYDDHGTLLGVPYAGGVEVDRERHTLPRFGLELWAGVVFVNLDRDAPQLAPQLGGMEPFLRNYQLDRYRFAGPWRQPELWNANWKLVLENGMESYHLFKVHPGTFEPSLPTAGVRYLAGGPRWSLTTGTMAFDPGPRSAVPAQAGNFERNHYVLVSIPPSFVGLLTLSSWAFIAVWPSDNEHTAIVQSVRTAARPSWFDKITYSAITNAFMQEDRTICERIQSGMQAEHSSGGQLVPIERVVGDFHRYLAARLFEGGCPSRA
jgi:phenylpropionate dioxygenase-like ring-hydroxylating dioxygenase large terminal subunit